MATGPEHYLEAERLLSVAKTYDSDSAPMTAAIRRQEAQVHALLALTAATATMADVAADAANMRHTVVDAWDKVITSSVSVGDQKAGNGVPQVTVANVRALIDSPEPAAVLYIKRDDETGQVGDLDVWVESMVPFGRQVITRDDAYAVLKGDHSSGRIRSLLGLFQRKVDETYEILVPTED